MISSITLRVSWPVFIEVIIIDISGPANKILRIRKRKTKGREFAPIRQLKAEPPRLEEMEEKMKEGPIIIDMFSRTGDPEDSTEKVRLGEDGSLHISLLRY